MSQTFEHIQVVYQMQKLTESVAKSPQFRTLQGNRRRRMEWLGQNLYIREKNTSQTQSLGPTFSPNKTPEPAAFGRGGKRLIAVSRSVARARNSLYRRGATRRAVLWTCFRHRQVEKQHRAVRDVGWESVREGEEGKWPCVVEWRPAQ